MVNQFLRKSLNAHKTIILLLTFCLSLETMRFLQPPEFQSTCTFISKGNILKIISFFLILLINFLMFKNIHIYIKRKG